MRNWVHLPAGRAVLVAGVAVMSMAVAIPRSAGAAVATTTAVTTPSGSNSWYTQPVTVTATVSPSDGGGTVAFSVLADPSGQFCSSGLSIVSGSTYRASCTWSGMRAGSFAFQAVYSGDTGYASSQGTVGHYAAPLQTTMYSLTSSLNPSLYGQAVTFNAGAQSQIGTILTGATTFYSSTSYTTIPGCQSRPSDGFDGQGSIYHCTSSALDAGSYAVLAQYRDPDPNIQGSGACLNDYFCDPRRDQQVVQAAPTSIAASSQPVIGVPPNPSGFLLSATLTVNWSHQALAGQSITFSAGSTVLCANVKTDAGGTATCMTSSQSLFTNAGFTARFAGTQNFVASNGNGSLA